MPSLGSVMRLTRISYFLLVSSPLFAMELASTLVRSCDPSKPEERRGWVGGLLRKCLKDWGALDKDLAGLGKKKEADLTNEILEQLLEDPGNSALQKKYTDRQAIVSRMALSLTASLEQFVRNYEKNVQEKNIEPYEKHALENDLFELINLSKRLRAIHHAATLAPLRTRQLICATNEARALFKKSFGLTDSNNNNQHQNPLLKEEPEIELDDNSIASIVQSAPKELILERASKDPEIKDHILKRSSPSFFIPQTIAFLKEIKEKKNRNSEREKNNHSKNNHSNDLEAIPSCNFEDLLETIVATHEEEIKALFVKKGYTVTKQ